MECECRYNPKGLRTMEQAILGALKRHEYSMEEVVKKYIARGYKPDEIELTQLKIETEHTHDGARVVLTQRVRTKKKS